MLMFWRLFLAVTLISSFVVLLFVALALLQFNQIRSQLARERVAVLTDRTAAPFEAAARIGLPLATVRNMDAVLERARQIDEAITSIHLFGPGGELVRSTSSKTLSPPLATLFEAPGEDAGRTWSGETENGFFSGTRMFDVDDKAAGAVVIEYSGEDSLMRSWAMTAQLVAGGFVFVLSAVVAIGAALRLLLRREIAAFDALEADAKAFERQMWRSGDGAAHEDGGTALRRMMAEAENHYRAAARATGAAATT